MKEKLPIKPTDVVLWGLGCCEFIVVFLAYFTVQANPDPRIWSLVGFVTLGIAILAAWRVTYLRNTKPTYASWFAHELVQIQGLKDRGALNADQAAYISDIWREITREQQNFIQARDRYTTIKIVSIVGAAVTACSAGLTKYAGHDLTLLTVLSSLVTVLATSLRTEYSTDVAEWAHYRKWSVLYQAETREYLNLSGRYAKFGDQGAGYKTFVLRYESLREREVKEFFQVITPGPSGAPSAKPSAASPKSNSKKQPKPNSQTQPAPAPSAIQGTAGSTAPSDSA